MRAGDTIFALSSGAGRAGVAVIRVSGAQAGAVALALAGGLPHPRRAVVRRLRHPHSGDMLDEALLLYFAGPQSFTGEDVLEVHVHGGRAVVRAVLAAIGVVEGCRPAEAGEFTYRAFLAGKIDLTGAEALADLIDSDTDRQRSVALQAMGGAHRDAVERWRALLVESMAYLEAMIDFSDEGDVAEDLSDEARRPLTELVDALGTAIASAGRGERLRDGVRVVIAGPPNVGKSSLLNALARRDVAIVTPEAGTTRDVLEVVLDLDGVPVVLADTAGLRETGAVVEREGIRRAMERIETADLVLWLTAPDVPAGHPPDGVPVWRVNTKADLSGPTQVSTITISARTGAGISDLLAQLARFAADTIGPAELSPPVMHERHRQALVDAHEIIVAALAQWSGRPLELIADDLRRAARALGRVTGAVDVEAVLDQVFGRFCIGK